MTAAQIREVLLQAGFAKTDDFNAPPLTEAEWDKYVNGEVIRLNSRRRPEYRKPRLRVCR